MGLENPRRQIFSIIIPARNEEETLPSTIEHIRKSARAYPTEIIVVDGQSEDGTYQVAKERADKIFTTHEAQRALQMHEGAKMATGKFLIFLHADTILPNHWQESLIRAWSATEKPALTAFRLRFDEKTFLFKSIATLANWRTRWITGVPHGDQAICVEKQTYLKLGGFPHVPLMEEYFLTQKMRSQGRVKILADFVTTSTRRYRKNGPLFNNMRNISLLLLFHAGVSPHSLAKLYR